jgi:(R,R)-butanediol dehydrogenase/meso-butanediol dehydrogenase/diacetyl reductase
MNAQAVYAGKRTFCLQSADAGDLAAGEVRIDVAYTGICGTDLHIFHGDMDQRVPARAVIGHEMSGRIAELGADVTGWAVGDPVTVMPIKACQTCPACIDGNSHICHNLEFMGIDSAGSMQQSWVVPAGTLLRLPADLDLRDAALIEPCAVAVHDVRRAGVTAGEHVVVVGGGPIGVLIASVAAHEGAEVVVIELDAHRRALAQALGLRTLDPSAVEVPKWVEEWTGGAGVPVAFEVSGSAAGLTSAAEVLAARGRLCLVAIHSVPRSMNMHRFFWRELSLVGARLYTRSDFERAIDLVAAGVIPAGALVSRVVPLADVTDAFDALESGAGVMKVLVECRPSDLA